MLSSGVPAAEDTFVLQVPGTPCQIVRGHHLVHPDLRTQLFPCRHGQDQYFCAWDTGDLEVYRLSGGKILRLTHSPSLDNAVAVAPDGTVFFASDRTGHWEIWRMDREGHHLQQVTHFCAFTTHPLPVDGGIVVASDKDSPGDPDPKSADGHYDLYLLDAEGHEKRKLTQGPGDKTSPALLEEGRILYANNASGRLEIWILEGEKARQITHSECPDRERNVYAPVVMPNGRILVSVHETMADPRLSTREYRYVALLDLAGKMTPLTDPSRSNASTRGF